MAVYQTLINAAKRMIIKKGQKIEWVSQTNDTPVDLTQQWKNVPVTKTSYFPTIVFIPNERYGREMFRYFSGSDIPVGNILGYMSWVTFAPSLKDVVIRDGKTLSILSITPYDPNGEGVILYAIEFDGIKSV